MNRDKFYDEAYAQTLTTGPKIVLGVIAMIIGPWLTRPVNHWIVTPER